MSLRAASLLAACLVGSAGASSLTVAMTDIRGRGEFDPKEPPDHKTDIKVGVYLEHLLDVSTEDHSFAMDFYVTLEWVDDRNYSSLFADEQLVQTEPDSCVAQRSRVRQQRKKNRQLLTFPGGGRARRLAETSGSSEDISEDISAAEAAEAAWDAEFDPSFLPAQGEIVKYFHRAGATAFTATVATVGAIATGGNATYSITYEEGGLTVTRSCLITEIGAMPQPARTFVEFGHDEISLIWIPDVHITNLHQGMMTTHEELLRVYDDGQVEFIRFVWARLDLHESVAIGHPVDSLLLEVRIASLSHSTERITIREHPTMNGLEESLVEKGIQ